MYDRDLQHPAITRAEREGPPEEVFPQCPVCGEETDTLYVDREGAVLGCMECVTTRDAWEAGEERLRG